MTIPARAAAGERPREPARRARERLPVLLGDVPASVGEEQGGADLGGDRPGRSTAGDVAGRRDAAGGDHGQRGRAGPPPSKREQGGRGSPVVVIGTSPGGRPPPRPGPRGRPRRATAASRASSPEVTVHQTGKAVSREATRSSRGSGQPNVNETTAGRARARRPRASPSSRRPSRRGSPGSDAVALTLAPHPRCIGDESGRIDLLPSGKEQIEADGRLVSACSRSSSPASTAAADL